MDGFVSSFDQRLQRPVSIRLIPAVVHRDQTLSRRYLQATQNHMRLYHPNILSIYEFDAEQLVTEPVEGILLKDFLDIPGGDRRAFGPTLQGPFLQQLLDALEYAHQQGVVHRQLTPDCIWLFPHDQVRLWGFGLKFYESQVSEVPDLADPLFYMSPEQARGDRCDQRSDLWQVGVLLYYMISGRRPFEAENLPVLIGRILSGQPPELSSLAPETPAPLAGAVMRCLRIEPEQRFQSVSELRSALFDVPDSPLVSVQEAVMHHALATSYYHQGRFAEAVAEWRKAVEADPQDPAYRNNFGVACWRNGETRLALDWLEQVGSWFNAGLVYFHEGRFEDAAECLRKAVIIQPRLQNGYLLRGECLERLGRTTEAIEECQKALILDPTSARALTCLSRLFAYQGRREEAETYAQMAGPEEEIAPIMLIPTALEQQ